MAIKSLYNEYFQKSRVFLYPALDIKRASSVTPIMTHISWKEYYKPDDCKLICLYHLRDDQEYRIFEKTRLFGNKLFHEFKETCDDRGVYIFDLKPFEKDFKYFLRGQYSMMSDDHKKKIKNFYGYNSPNYAYVESFLHPDKYFKMYSEMIQVEEKILKDVGELCDRPDLDQEHLDIAVKSLEMKREMQ